MSTLRKWAERFPDKEAALLAFRDVSLTYRALDQRANAVTQLLMWMGIAQGDGIAILLDNDLAYYELAWGARRHGVYYTPVSTHLTPDEAVYIVQDSGAKVLFVDARFGDTVERLLADNPKGCRVITLNGTLAGTMDYTRELDR